MAQPGEWSTDRLAAALSRPDRNLLRRMSTGVAVLGHPEEPPGSCVLVVDNPLVQRLVDLPRERRLMFLNDLDRLGEAVHNVCWRRDPEFRCVDLEIGGDGDLLHARVRPRYTREDRRAAGTGDDRHHDLRLQLVQELDRICAAGRADFPTEHMHGSRPTRRSV